MFELHVHLIWYYPLVSQVIDKVQEEAKSRTGRYCTSLSIDHVVSIYIHFNGRTCVIFMKLWFIPSFLFSENLDVGLHFVVLHKYGL